MLLFVMSFGPQFENGASKEIELNGHLDGHGRVDDGGELVSGKDLERVVPKVQDGDEFVVANALQPLQGKLSLFFQGNVVSWNHDRFGDELAKLLPHFVVVVIQKMRQLFHWKLSTKRVDILKSN